MMKINESGFLSMTWKPQKFFWRASFKRDIYFIFSPKWLHSFYQTVSVYLLCCFWYKCLHPFIRKSCWARNRRYRIYCEKFVVSFRKYLVSKETPLRKSNIYFGFGSWRVFTVSDEKIKLQFLDWSYLRNGTRSLVCQLYYHIWQLHFHIWP